jgi:hypothetical protein
MVAVITPRVWDGSSYWAPGRAPINPLPDRDALVPGNWRPDLHPEWIGPVEGTTFTDVYPTSGQVITVSTSSPYVHAGVVDGVRFWGQVKFAANAAGLIFKNCWFVGPDPAVPTGNGIWGCISSYGGETRHVKIIDSIIDPSLWWTVEGRLGNPLIVGIHGGDMELLRCEIVNCQDGVNFLGPTGSLAIAQAAFFTMESCWVHKGYYTNNWYGPSDGQPHCDGFQTNTGKNITIRGCTIGGERDVTGYIVWPGGYNAGDDFWNAAFMIKQESSNDDIRRIENVLIEKNWIGGGTASINFSYNPTYPNTYASTVIRDNWFFNRGANWGQKMSGDGAGTNTGHRTDTANGTGWYILRGTQLQATFSNNRNLSTGQLVPISNG